MALPRKKHASFEVVPGFVFCSRHGEIHEDSLGPYQYGEEDDPYHDMRCVPAEHRPVYIFKKADEDFLV